MDDLLALMQAHATGMSTVADWKKRVLVPIEKPNKSHDQPKGFRWISIMHSVQKLLESIFERRLSPILKKRIPLWQGGGIAKREAAEIAFTLNRYLRLRKSQGLNTYCLFLDAVQAYDLVDREILYECLKKFGFDEASVQWVRSMHEDVTNEVNINGISVITPSTVGIPQGSPISPALYVIWHYICAITYDKIFELKKMIMHTLHDEVIDHPRIVSSEAKGVFMDIALLAYVDDTTILAQSFEEITLHAKQWIKHNMKFSSKIHIGHTSVDKNGKLVQSKCKSTYMEFRHNSWNERQEDPPEINLDHGNFIPWVPHMKHLGTHYDDNIGFNRHLSILIGRLAAKYKSLKATIWNNKQVPIHLRKRYYELHFIPVLSYNSEGLPIGTRAWRLLNIAQSFEEITLHAKQWIKHNMKFSSKIHIGHTSVDKHGKLVQSKCKSTYMEFRHNSWNERQEDPPEINLDHDNFIPWVPHMKHLGTHYDDNIGFNRHLSILIGRLAAKYKSLKATIWNNKHVPVYLRKRYYELHFIPVLSYNSEGLPIGTRAWRLLNNFHNDCVRDIAGVNWKMQAETHIKLDECFKISKLPSLLYIFNRNLLGSVGRWVRKGSGSWANGALSGYIFNNDFEEQHKKRHTFTGTCHGKVQIMSGEGKGTFRKCKSKLNDSQQLCFCHAHRDQGGVQFGDDFTFRFTDLLTRLKVLVTNHGATAYKLQTTNLDGDECEITITNKQAADALTNKLHDHVNRATHATNLIVDNCKVTWRTLFGCKSFHNKLIILFARDRAVRSACMLEEDAEDDDQDIPHGSNSLPVTLDTSSSSSSSVPPAPSSSSSSSSSSSLPTSNIQSTMPIQKSHSGKKSEKKNRPTNVRHHRNRYVSPPLNKHLPPKSLRYSSRPFSPTPPPFPPPSSYSTTTPSTTAAATATNFMRSINQFHPPPLPPVPPSLPRYLGSPLPRYQPQPVPPLQTPPPFYSYVPGYLTHNRSRFQHTTPPMPPVLYPSYFPRPSNNQKP